MMYGSVIALLWLPIVNSVLEVRHEMPGVAEHV